MVQWTVALARNIPPEKLARVSSYDALGSVMAMPVGAVLAGPIAAAVGVSATQYGAAALILVASALALIPRDVRQMRADHALPPATAAAEVAELAGSARGPRGRRGYSGGGGGGRGSPSPCRRPRRGLGSASITAGPLVLLQRHQRASGDIRWRYLKRV